MLRSYFIMRIFIFCFAIVNLISISKSFAQISLILPKNNWVQTDTIVNFSWNICHEASNYELQISNQSDFSNNVSYIIFQNDTSLILPFDIYYFRVRCIFNNYVSLWSKSYSFNIINLHNLGDLVVWLDANSMVDTITGGKVTLWNDLSGNNNNFRQTNPSNQPSLTKSLYLNNKHYINFNGSHSLFSINNFSFLNASIIILSSQNNSEVNYGRLIDHDTNVGFWIGRNADKNQIGGGFIETVNPAGNFVNINNNTPCILSMIRKNATTFSFLNSNTFPISSRTTNSNPTAFNPIAIGSRTINSAYGKKNVYEVIIYNDSISNQNKFLIEMYLKFKYTPPINLGADIHIDYGFCDTTISAYKPWFTSYLWNTNETDSIISVDSSGFYSVTVTDIFGFTSFDSVYVQFPGNINEYNNSLFCSNDSILINTNLSHDGYTFLWSNNLTDSAIYVKNGELLSLTFTDSLGCFRVQTIEIFEDTLARINIFLNSDTSICSNNLLTIELNDFLPLDFFWSTSQTTSSIIINNSDNYSVTVTNENGCQAMDTIFVHVVGEAPTPLFSADTVCLGLPTTFTDLSFSIDLSNINSWHWDFGDNNSSLEQHPQHIYNQFGVFDVTLTLETDSGCGSNIEKEIIVKPSPLANFNITSNACTENSYEFSSTSLPPQNESLIQHTWNFGNTDTASGENINYTYFFSGIYQVKLIVKTENGCQDSIAKQLKVVNSAPSTQKSKLIYPSNNFVTDKNVVKFSWDNLVDVSNYTLQLSTDEHFNNIIFEEINIKKTEFTSSELPYQTLFWRIYSYNACNDFVKSQSRKFTIINLHNLGDLVVWLDANSMVDTITGGKVTLWNDLSGNNNNFRQTNPSNQPSLTKSLYLNNKHYINFNGSHSLFSINNFSFLNASIIILSSQNNSEVNYGRLIDHDTNVGFWIGRNADKNQIGGGFIETVNPAGNFVNINNNTPCILSMIRKNATTFSFLNSNTFPISSRTTNSNPTAFNPIAIGSRTINSAYGKKNVYEVIIYNDSISNQNKFLIEMYLKFKYAPPVNLGADIHIDYGFCDTTISAYKPWFTSYLWNTNETDSIISVDSSGFYSVTVTDIFGFTSYDSVYVKYPGNINEYNNSLFCSNDSILINTNLSHDGYTFLWSNNLTDSAIYVKNGELLSLTITDSLGCFRSQTIEIFEDTLARINIFPNSDTSLCSNNFLTPELNAFSPLDFFWSTSQTTSSIIINNSDNYSVTVTNENGCQAIDTIFVHVVGEAPTPLFSADTVCLGFPTTFTDQSFSTDLSNINYWHWDFGDGSSDVTQHPQHLYDNFGVFDVTLTLETDSGCGNKIIKKVLVNRIPEFDFNISYSQPCTGENYPINFSGEDHLNTISEWQWTFEDVNAANFDDNSGSDVAHVYQNAGTYFSRLVVWDDNGCTDTTFKKLVIYPTPQPDFVYTPDCEGKTSAFTDNTPNAATNWNWQWNATGISGNIGSTPMFSYNFLNGGGYNVTMTVQTPQQCVAQTVKNIFIPKKPNVQFSITDFCINTPIQVFDESTVLNSYPVKWHWNVLNHPNESSEQHPNFTFPEQNNLNKYSLRLVVESVEGCKDSTTKTITVHKEPTADFTFNPKFGQPPLAVNFSNQSSEDVIAYHWSFGDNQFSELENPVHLYIDSAVYDIQLKVNNEFGCADSTTKFIKVLLPTLDLAIANAKSSLVNDRYLTITANIINLGTRAVFDFNLFLVSSDNVVIREVWEGELLTNQVIPYQFTASFDTEQQTTPKYICVKVDHPNGEQDENMSNNEYCLTFSDFTVFDPYPNPTFETLNLLIIIPKNSNIEIKLLNQIGQEVRNLYSGQLNKGIQKFDYDISTLRNGIYTLKFSNGEEVILKTFIKQ
jgi:PKD repeat protein